MSHNRSPIMQRFSTPYCGTACNGKLFKNQWDKDKDKAKHT